LRHQPRLAQHVVGPLGLVPEGRPPQHELAPWITKQVRQIGGAARGLRDAQLAGDAEVEPLEVSVQRGLGELLAPSNLARFVDRRALAISLVRHATRYPPSTVKQAPVV